MVRIVHHPSILYTQLLFFYFFKAAMLSFKAAILVSASACFLRSISITFAGALLTNFSLPSFFKTLFKNPS